MQNFQWLIVAIAITFLGCAGDDAESTAVTTPTNNDPLRSLETSEEGDETAE